MSTPYSRSAVVEPFRKLCRALDFVILCVVLRLRNNFPRFRTWRKTIFIELGPGPMRLAWLKRCLFREVYFVDRFDFDSPDPGLRIHDLESCHDVDEIVDGVCKIPHDSTIMIFADHFLEHIPEQSALSLLESALRRKVAACFRVPNVESQVGQHNFGNDPTHQNSFDGTFREILRRLGYGISPWMRFYRPQSMASGLQLIKRPMQVAEEIVICSRIQNRNQ